MKAERIPVWLVTGYLGSGKTTLLARWLRDPALARAALVVNEIGEVGFDDRQLAQAVDSASLIGNACVCCTGLPGLEQALTDLWWDRLQRRRPRFDAVVIETTGLADPGPVVAAFAAGQSLAERYCLAGVITTASASAGPALIDAHAEAQAQIAAADVVVVTKLDKAAEGALVEHIDRLHPGVAIARSAHASVAWPAIAALCAGAAAARSGPSPHANSGHSHTHVHGAGAGFIPMPEPVSAEALGEIVHAMLLQQHAMLRIKGIVQLQDGSLQSVQWAAGDSTLALLPFHGEAPRLGLTCIGTAASMEPGITSVAH